MQKRILITWILCALLTLAVFGAERTVYVADGGTGSGTTAQTPCGTLAAACNALGGEGGTVCLVGDTTLSTITTVPEQSGDLTITAQNGARLIYKSRLQFAKNANDNVITLDVPLYITADWYMFGGFNNIVFTENATMTGGGTLFFYGGMMTRDAASIGECITELPYSITVHAGTFGQFAAGNLRLAGDNYIGSIAAPVTLTVTGGTFGKADTAFVAEVEGEHFTPTTAPLKTFQAFTVGGMGFLADDVTLDISGGTFHMPIYISGRIGTTHSPAQSVSAFVATDRKYYAQDGDVTVNISDGTFLGGAVCDTYVDAGYSRLMRGDYTVTVTGGTFAEGTVFDATQVKPYAGESKKATLTVVEGIENITPRRFDVVNGEEQTYAEPTRVAFIGDSITEGHSSGNANTQSYPAAFLKTAIAAGKDVIVSNLGVSASGMLPATRYYYPAMLPYPLALEEVDADLFFFALGTNDAYVAGETMGAGKLFYDGYKAFIKACGDLPDTDGVYVSSALIRGRGVGVYCSRVIGSMRPMQKAIATELAALDADKYHFVDLYTLTYDEAIVYTTDADGNETSPFFAADNLHPHAEGYKVMGQCVYDAFYNGVYGVDDFTMTDVYLSDSGREFGVGTKEDPASSLVLALSRCAPNATVHIVGTSTWTGRATVPQDLGALTIVGEGEGARWLFPFSDLLYFDCDVEIDNLTLSVADGAYLEIFGKYNDVTFGEGFASEGDVRFSAGYPVYGEQALADLSTANDVDTAESVSSDADCTVSVLGGTFKWLSAGNRRRKVNSPFGTYSGNMSFTVGSGVTVTDAEFSGIVGMNYHVGKINATVNGWGDFPLCDNVTLGATDTIPYTFTKNTGTLTVSAAEGIDRTVTGDFNADGVLNVADALTALRTLLDGEAPRNFYNVKTLTLPSILYVLRRLAK